MLHEMFKYKKLDLHILATVKSNLFISQYKSSLLQSQFKYLIKLLSKHQFELKIFPNNKNNYSNQNDSNFAFEVAIQPEVEKEVKYFEFLGEMVPQDKWNQWLEIVFYHYMNKTSSAYLWKKEVMK